MIYTVTIYKQVYDFNGGFKTLCKVETVTGTNEEILKIFHAYMSKNPTIKYYYTVE